MKNKRNSKLWVFLNPLFLLLLMSIMSTTSVFAQTKTVSGEVFDSSNQPVIGASVFEKGTTNGTVTDMDGKFSIKVKQNSSLQISFVGFQTKVVTVNSDYLKITLKDNSELLNEVLVIGYGSVKRKDVTTAVSSVSTKDLEERPIVTAMQGVEGKAAGVSVMQANGQPGSTPTVRVRGTTSLNGSNDPLYVVDGVPMTDISYLSADDIENMQILKDASSAAIYGSRAANGVIMITTKQGQKGVSKISFNAHYSFNKVKDNIKPLNTAQYEALQKEIGLVNLPDTLKDETNWRDQTFRTGYEQNYQVAVTNGNDHLKYYLSGGYTGENGVVKTSSYQRYNFKLSVDNQIRSWLDINANVAYSDYTNKGNIISGQGANRGGLILAVVNTPTYAPVWDPKNPGQYNTNFYGVNITSPAENIARTKDNKTSNNRLLATGKAIITFFPGLKFSSSLTLDRTYSNTFNFEDPLLTEDGRNNKGTGYDSRSIGSVLIFDNVLNYTKSLGKNNIDAMAGSSWTNSKWSQSYINASDYANGDFQTLNAANKISWTGTGTTASNWAINSYFARVAYNYDNKYMLTGNIRADGSSKLAPGHRWGYFPSFSGAWRISSENFMKSFNWIDDLKLRGGWGQTGNQSGLGDYGYLAQYNINRIQWFGTGSDANAVPTFSQSTLSNPDLTWETTSQTDLGLDLTVLKNRLTFYMDYYYKKTTNMLMTVTLPAGSAPANSLVYNGGDMVNKGWEFSVNSKNLTGIFNWNTDFNISFNRNKLMKLYLTQVYYDAMTTDDVHDYVVRNAPGHPLGAFYGYISDGVDPETGNLKYRDVNKDGIISASDRTYIGNPNPKFTYGMTNSFSYKGLNLSILLQGSYGNDIYNVSRMETEGMYDGKNQSTRVLNRWEIPGQITNVPKANFNIKNSTYFLENGSYLRVKDISLSYNVSNQTLNKWGISRLQPYMSCSNLFTITKYKGMDPEVNQYGDSGSVQGIDYGTYPLCKSLVFGLNIEF